MGVINQKIKNGGIDPNYYDKTARAESGGRSDAKNPNSSASGLFQFTKGTWRAVVDKYGLKYTDNDRFDKYKSKEVMELFTRDNADQLKSYGITPNNTDLYTAHFMGVGGARKLLTAQREDPNQSVYNVASPDQIKANKSIFLHKDGTPKTVGQVYQILGDKINKTSNYATNYKKTDEYKNSNSFINLSIPTENTNLASVPEQSKEVETAKEEIQQKETQLNEQNFINELFANNEEIQQEEVVPQAKVPQQNILEKYAQIESFVDTPIAQTAQQGAIIKNNNGQWAHPGEITQISSPDITMKNVNYPVLGVADTGEKRMMYPNQDYHFSNAKTVTEYPQLTDKEKAFLKELQRY